MTPPQRLTGRHLRRLSGTAHGARIVCFPHAGGAANFFRPWTEHVPAGHQLVAVQYPGRQDLVDEAHPSSIQQLARTVAEELIHQQSAHASLTGPAEPTILFGHSLGASVAYEVAHVLTAAGRAPAHVVVSARPGPADHRVTRKDGWPTTDLWNNMVELGGTPPEFADAAELRDLVVPALRRDYRLADNYVATPEALSTRVTALAGDADPEATPEQMRSWAATTTAEFRQHVLSGGHFYLHDHLDHLVRLTLG